MAEAELMNLIVEGRFSEAEQCFLQKKWGDDFTSTLGNTLISAFNSTNVSDGLRTFMTRILRDEALSDLMVSCGRALTQPISHHLTKICIDVVISRMTEIMPQINDWVELLCEVWLVPIRKKLIHKMEETQSMRSVLQEFAAILDFFNKFTELRVLTFVDVFEAIFKKLSPNSLEMEELLPSATRLIPYHPYVVTFDSGNLIPKVLNPPFLVKKISKALTSYVSVGEEHRVHTNIPAVLTSLRLITTAVTQYPDYLKDPIEELLSSLFPYIQDFELEESRVELLRECEKILKLCTATSRVLILKRHAEKLSRNRLNLDGAPLILAWVVDIYKNNLMTEQVFQEELGYFWAQIEHVRYEDIPASLSYYTAVQNLFQIQILNRIRVPMLKIVKERLIDNMRDQLGDWITLQGMRANMPEEERADDFGILDMERPIENVDLLIYNFDFNNQLLAALLQ